MQKSAHFVNRYGGCMRILLVVDNDDTGQTTGSRCFVLAEQNEVQEVPKHLLSGMMTRFIVEHMKRVSSKFKEKAL